MTGPRPFELVRYRDPSGVSGTGVVAEGCVFTDGSVALRWLGEHPATSVWPELASVLAVHGHQGATEVRWVTDPAAEPASTEAEIEHLFGGLRTVRTADPFPGPFTDPFPEPFTDSFPEPFDEPFTGPLSGPFTGPLTGPLTDPGPSRGRGWIGARHLRDAADS